MGINSHLKIWLSHDIKDLNPILSDLKLGDCYFFRCGLNYMTKVLLCTGSIDIFKEMVVCGDCKDAFFL